MRVQSSEQDSVDEDEIVLVDVQKRSQRVDRGASLGKRQWPHPGRASEAYRRRLHNRPTGRRDSNGVPIRIAEIDEEIIAVSWRRGHEPHARPANRSPRISNASIAELTAVFFRLGPNARASTEPLSVRCFELTLHVSNVFEAKLFRSDRPRLPMAGNNQISVGSHHHQCETGLDRLQPRRRRQ